MINLKRVTNVSKACELIQTDGCATSISYAMILKNLIKQYDLTDWDLQVLESTNDVKTDSIYEVGRNKVVVDAIRVRKGLGTSYRQAKFTEMSKVSQKANSIKKSTGLAYYVKGTTFDALEVIKISPKECWAKTSGYVTLMYQGKSYVK